jgi:hypothetical protein
VGVLGSMTGISASLHLAIIICMPAVNGQSVLADTMVNCQAVLREIPNQSISLSLQGMVLWLSFRDIRLLGPYKTKSHMHPWRAYG